MIRTRPTLVALLAGTALALPLAAAAQTTMSPAETRARQAEIEANHEAADERCESLSGNAQDVCEEKAEGRKEVEQAELQHQRTGTAASARQIAEAEAEATYAAAQEKCDDLDSHRKDICIADAQKARAAALADAAAR